MQPINYQTYFKDTGNKYVNNISPTALPLPIESHENEDVYNKDHHVIYYITEVIKQCIDFYNLKSVPSLNVERIEEEVIAVTNKIIYEIDKIKRGINVDKSQLTTLVADLNSLISISKENIARFNIIGCSDLCNIFERLRLFFEMELSNISKSTTCPSFLEQDSITRSHFRDLQPVSARMKLKHALEVNKDNREFVLKAVGQNGLMLQYADDVIKRDAKVVYAAIKQNILAFQYANAELRHNWDFLLMSVGIQSCNITKSNFIDYSIYMLIVQEMMCVVLTECRNNRELLLAKVQKESGSALMFASEEFKDDPELVLMAVK